MGVTNLMVVLSVSVEEAPADQNRAGNSTPTLIYSSGYTLEFKVQYPNAVDSPGLLLVLLVAEACHGVLVMILL